MALPRGNAEVRLGWVYTAVRLSLMCGERRAGDGFRGFPPQVGDTCRVPVRSPDSCRKKTAKSPRLLPQNAGFYAAKMPQSFRWMPQNAAKMPQNGLKTDPVDNPKTC